MNITIPEDRPFDGFGKIGRAQKAMTCVITEKIDGTNAQIVIEDGKIVAVGSRKRWIAPGKTTDNYGFAGWVERNYEELLGLGDGVHFGEWYGSGIQCGYGLTDGEKHFALFNTDRWHEDNPPPECCQVVPVLYRGEFNTNYLKREMVYLSQGGSKLVPGFMKPEGVIVWLYGPRTFLKSTFDHPEGKWTAEAA